jgi:hypothetical protein
MKRNRSTTLKKVSGGGATLPIAETDVTNLVSDLASKAPLASPVFTGDPQAPTPLTADNDTSIATTAFVKAQGYSTVTLPITESNVTNLVSDLAAKAPLASPVFTGDPQAPTPLTADNDTSVATTAFVKAQNYLTGNQTITLTGDVTGSGATSIATTIATGAVTTAKFASSVYSATNPVVDGTATPGVAATVARSDHVHPTDTSRAQDTLVVHLAGAETISGIKTYSAAWKQTDATAAHGYATGSGGAVTQLTSRTTGVTLSKPNGVITLVSAAGSSTWTTFTVTNTLVAATDVIKLAQQSGANLYNLLVTKVAAGSFNISVSAVSGTTTEAPAINFAIVKAVNA